MIPSNFHHGPRVVLSSMYKLREGSFPWPLSHGETTICSFNKCVPSKDQLGVNLTLKLTFFKISITTQENERTQNIKIAPTQKAKKEPWLSLSLPKLWLSCYAHWLLNSSVLLRLLWDVLSQIIVLLQKKKKGGVHLLILGICEYTILWQRLSK
jgi:hypothetical protein